MKKQILKAFLVLAVVGASTSAMAAGTLITGIITIGAGNTFSPSTKVGISLISVPTSYSSASCHLNGTKQYATIGGSNLSGSYTDASKIYTADIPSQSSTNTTGVPTSQTDATAITGSWQ